MNNRICILAAGLAAFTAGSLRAQTFSIIRTLTDDTEGRMPRGTLLLNSNTLYGTAYTGGPSGAGTLFKVDTDGTGFSVLKSFSNAGGEGSNPHGALVLSGETLLGTTWAGGAFGNGTVFSVSTNGSDYKVLHSFGIVINSTNTDGAMPQAGLAVCGSTLYGAAMSGGAWGAGTIFKMNADGTAFTVLNNFDRTNGALPSRSLLPVGDMLYGTTYSGGGADGGGYGTIFKVRTNGTGFATIKEFAGSDGQFPSELVLSGDALYGTTGGGGDFNEGTIFKISTNGSSFETLKHFPARVAFTNTGGADPESGLLLNGNTLYGTTFLGGCLTNGTLYKINTDGTGFAVLKNFGRSASGANPVAGLTLGGSTLYGATAGGGSVIFSLVVLPEIQTTPDGFNLTGVAGQTVTIEAANNPTSSVWEPIETNTLPPGPLYFTDPARTNHMMRFYRARQP